MGGKRQSPINIQTKYTTSIQDSIQFTNYDKEIDSLTLVNSGHTGKYDFIAANLSMNFEPLPVLLYPLFLLPFILAFTASITVKSENKPTISNKLIGENVEYILPGFHFHWGETSDNGSEHHIDGNKYPLEMR